MCVWVRVVMQCLYIVYGWWLNRWSAVSMLFQLSCWKNTKTKSKQYDNIVYEAENGYALTERSHLEWIKASNECFCVRVSARVCVFVRASFISFPPLRFVLNFVFFFFHSIYRECFVFAIIMKLTCALHRVLKTKHNEKKIMIKE